MGWDEEFDTFLTVIVSLKTSFYWLNLKPQSISLQWLTSTTPHKLNLKPAQEYYTLSSTIHPGVYTAHYRGNNIGTPNVFSPEFFIEVAMYLFPSFFGRANSLAENANYSLNLFDIPEW